jgi:gliding motility-associated-like protein
VAYVHDVEIPKYAFSGNCESDSIAFSAIINGPDSIALVKWKFHDNDSSVMGNVKKQYSGAGNYAVQLEYVMTSGCKKDSTFSMKIDPDPETTLGYLLPCDDENVVVFNTINSSTLIVSKNWEKDGVLAMATDTLKFKGIPNQLYNISVEIIDANGCSDTSIISLNPLESPIPSFTTDEVCQGLPTTFTNTSLLNGATISSFEFNLGDGNLKKDLNTFQHTYAKSGSYPAVLTLTNAKSCTYDSLMQVIVHPNPVAGFDVSPDLLDVLNSDIDVIDRSKGASIINYFISDGTNYFGPDFTHSFLDSGNYNILQRVENDFGCLDSASRMLTVNFRYAVWIPNAFTPNKDNINQVFRPYGDGVERFSMQIFNRWGEKVFETIDSNIAWDGNDALPGLYVYILTVTDYDEIPHYYKGLIQLIR